MSAELGFLPPLQEHEAACELRTSSSDVVENSQQQIQQESSTALEGDSGNEARGDSGNEARGVKGLLSASSACSQTAAEVKERSQLWASAPAAGSVPAAPADHVWREEGSGLPLFENVFSSLCNTRIQLSPLPRRVQEHKMSVYLKSTGAKLCAAQPVRRVEDTLHNRTWQSFSDSNSMNE